MKKYIYLSLFLTLMITSCGVKQNIGTRNLSIDCLGDNLDGTITVKSWGTAKEVEEAIVDAEKKALNEVIFKGIRMGDDSCGMVPLLTSVNAKYNNKEFFIDFFKPNGEYKKFIVITESNLTKSRKTKSTIKSSKGIAHSIVVKVKKSELKKYLKSKNIK